jgi:hypothetical protein
MRTPSYTITQWANHLSYLSHKTHPLRIQLFHIPGHTPDSLAWYDIDEHHLYVGDAFYTFHRRRALPGIPDGAGQVPGLPGTQAAIIFPEEGNWLSYTKSMGMLFEFVTRENETLRRRHGVAKTETQAPRVRVAAGHITQDEDAESLISDVMSLFMRIVAGAVPVVRSGCKRNVIYDYWVDPDEPRFAVMAPRRLCDEAKKALEQRI